MAQIPPEIKIDIVAVNKAWGEMIRRVGEYFQGIQKVMSNWLPAVSAAKRYEINRVHTLYGRKRKSRQRKNRRR